jgi:hypothetical protein
MPRVSFNESELYLLKNWTSACRLEEAMNRVRHEKYNSIIARVTESLIDQLGKSEYRQETYPTQKWDDGIIYFWMKSWGKSGDSPEAPYFCLGGLRLEFLMSVGAASNKEPLPYACLYANDLRKAGWDLGSFRNKLYTSAAKVLESFPRRSDEDDANPVCYYLPEGRDELRRLLMEDEEGFTSLLLEHGLRLAELAPFITKILANPK